MINLTDLGVQPAQFGIGRDTGSGLLRLGGVATMPSITALFRAATIVRWTRLD
jgi:hypothetical protein